MYAESFVVTLKVKCSSQVRILLKNLTCLGKLLSGILDRGAGS
jgi:hypothetical protein